MERSWDIKQKFEHNEEQYIGVDVSTLVVKFVLKLGTHDAEF